MAHFNRYNVFDTVNIPEYGVYGATILGSREYDGRVFYDVQYTYGKNQLVMDCFAEEIIERVS